AARSKSVRSRRPDRQSLFAVQFLSGQQWKRPVRTFVSSDLVSSDVLSGLPHVARTHSQAELSFQLTQSLDEIYCLSPVDWFTVDYFFALPHQRFELTRVDFRTRGDARGDF